MAMERMLIIIATVLLVLGVNCGASTSPPPPRPFPPQLVAIAYLVLLDHVIASNPVSKKTESKKTVSPSGKTQPKTLVPRVFPARIGLW